jgi:hypothetical protein
MQAPTTLLVTYTELNCWTLGRSQVDKAILRVSAPLRLQKATIFVPINLFCIWGPHPTPRKSIFPAKGQPVLNRAVLFQCFSICVSLKVPLSAS